MGMGNDICDGGGLAVVYLWRLVECTCHFELHRTVPPNTGNGAISLPKVPEDNEDPAVMSESVGRSNTHQSSNIDSHVDEVSLLQGKSESVRVSEHEQPDPTQKYLDWFRRYYIFFSSRN